MYGTKSTRLTLIDAEKTWGRMVDFSYDAQHCASPQLVGVEGYNYFVINQHTININLLLVVPRSC